MLTESAHHFWEKADEYAPDYWTAFQEAEIKVYHNKDEWTTWKRMGDPVLHIEVTEQFHFKYYHIA